PQAEDHGVAVRDRARNAQHTAEQTENQRLDRQLFPDDLHLEPNRTQEADFAAALLDAQPEEQRREQERGQDQKEAEVGEVLAEIGRPTRSLESVLSDISHGHTEAQRIDRGADLLLEALAGGLQRQTLRRHDAYRGAIPVTRAPERLPNLERNERLGRRSIRVPVLFVDRSDFPEINWERGIPIGEA